MFALPGMVRPSHFASLDTWVVKVLLKETRNGVIVRIDAAVSQWWYLLTK